MIGGNSVFRTFDSRASPPLSRLQLQRQWKFEIQNIYYSSNMKRLKPTLKFEDEVLVLETKIKPYSSSLHSLSPPFSLPSLTPLSLSLLSLTHPYRFCFLKNFNLLFNILSLFKSIKFILILKQESKKGERKREDR